jgi:uncharacterized protein
MLRNCFQHIPGIGEKTENKLWNSGIIDWNSFLKAGQIKLSKKRIATIKAYIKESSENLHSSNPKYFCDLLPASQHWRIFSDFKNSTAYIDIETTGMDSWNFDITTIALYDGSSIKYYINGHNLGDFLDDIEQYKVIVSYNGKTFDVPFIEKYFNTKLNHAHIDLRYVLKNLGYSGGLKKCEKAMGIDRGDLAGVDGYFAVLLWHDYKQNKNKKAIETLLAYNIEDVVNLETLMIMAYNMKIETTPFFDTPQLPIPQAPKIPFKPDLETIDRIRHHFISSSETYQYR